MNRKPVFLTILYLCLCPAVLLADNQNQNFNQDQAKQNYHAYLEQLKAISQQYSQITGEMKKVLKEEGVPEWDENTGGINIKPYTDTAPSSKANPVLSQARIQETDKDMTVGIDLPGAKKGSIKVSIQDGRFLHVTASRTIQSVDQAIEKVVSLPSPAQETGAQAKYEDGVLTITILKNAKKEVTVPLN